MPTLSNMVICTTALVLKKLRVRCWVAIVLINFLANAFVAEMTHVQCKEHKIITIHVLGDTFELTKPIESESQYDMSRLNCSKIR